MGDPPIGAPRLVKIVRDRVERLLSNVNVRFGAVENHQLAVEALRKKLVEEAVEYCLDPSENELADVLETVHALAFHDLQVTQDTIEKVCCKKRGERGDFTDLTGMWIVTS